MLNIILVFILGACVGSALNCLVERKITGRSWFRGRSSCPHCGHALRWYELIPVISFAIQGGRCRACGKPLCWQYLFAELSLGLFFALAWSRAAVDLSAVSVQNFWPLLIVGRDWLMLCFLAFIFWYDYRQKLILDVCVVLGAALAISFNIFLGIIWWRILLGAAVLAGFFALQYIISRGRWIGLGDVKLGVFLGCLVAWPSALALLFIAYLVGAAVSLILLWRHRATAKTALAFGPFLTLAAAVTLLYGQDLVQWYLARLGF